MKKLLFALSFLLVSIMLFAQEHKPVQFRFEAKRFTDSTGELLIYVSIEKGISLFSTKQLVKDAVFISSIKADTARKIEYATPDKIVEKGKVSVVTIDTVNYTAYTDSLLISIPFVLKTASENSIAGHFIWLAKQ